MMLNLVMLFVIVGLIVILVALLYNESTSWMYKRDIRQAKAQDKISVCKKTRIDIDKYYADSQTFVTHQYTFIAPASSDYYIVWHYPFDNDHPIRPWVKLYKQVSQGHFNNSNDDDTFGRDKLVGYTPLKSNKKFERFVKEVSEEYVCMMKIGDKTTLGPHGTKMDNIY